MKTDAKNITCKLTTPELQKRKATIIADLRQVITERAELQDGHAFKFLATDEMLDKLTEFIKTERLCCDFFTFQLTVEEETAWLKVTGPAGSKEFLEKEVGL